jgi:hypothetical protein
MWSVARSSAILLFGKDSGRGGSVDCRVLKAPALHRADIKKRFKKAVTSLNNSLLKPLIKHHSIEAI